MTDPGWHGGCLCGELSFDVTGEPRDVCYCHCGSCRAASGAPFVVWGTFLTDRLRVMSGELTIYRSSDQVERGFCDRCGTTVTYCHEDRPAEIDISITTLRDADEIRPSRHIWVSEKSSWLVISDGLPQFAQWSQGEGGATTT